MLDGGECQGHAPAALPPGKRAGTHCIGGWVGSRAGLDGCGKCGLSRNFFCFVFSYILFELHPYLFVCLDCPAFCLLSLLYSTHTHTHPAGFEPAVTASDWPPTLALRPLGHCDRLGIRSLDRPARSESTCRLSYRGPFTY